MGVRQFNFPVRDRHEAEFWRDEWQQRFRETNDHAFKEFHDDMVEFIEWHWPEVEHG